MPLMTLKDVQELSKMLGRYKSKELAARGTGKTTRIALRTLLEALDNPGSPVKIVDHHPTHAASLYLFDRMKRMAQELGLDYLDFNKSKLTVTFTYKSPTTEYMEKHRK